MFGLGASRFFVREGVLVVYVLNSHRDGYAWAV